MLALACEAALVFGYLLGSIPFGLLVARIFRLGDIRKTGSRNIGATNVLRTGNKWAAALTLLLDGGKGAVAVLAAREIGGDLAAMWAAFASFVGHVFPVWLDFKGGKGVATFLGLTLALAWPVGIMACMTWLGAAVLWRTSSLASLVSAAATPVYLAFWNEYWFAAIMVFLAALIFATHRENIRRLRRGDEPKIGANVRGAA
ncbi:MAG: glycerol-3-phosphate 1-O-acyltransferase PlsY [Alphaproteobacteria bacterium]